MAKQLSFFKLEFIHRLSTNGTVTTVSVYLQRRTLTAKKRSDRTQRYPVRSFFLASLLGFSIYSSLVSRVVSLFTLREKPNTRLTSNANDFVNATEKQCQQETSACILVHVCVALKDLVFEQLWSGNGYGVDYCGLKSGMVFKENTRGGGVGGLNAVVFSALNE